MTFPCFFAVYRNGQSSHTFQYSQFDHHQSGFIVLLPAGISANLDIVGQYNVIRKASFDRILSNLALQHFSEAE